MRNRGKLHKLPFLFAALLFTVLSAAAEKLPPVILSNENHTIEVDSILYLHSADQSKITPVQILNPDNFKKRKLPYFDYTPGYHVFSLEIKTVQPSGSFWLRIPFLNSEELKCYYSKTGDTLLELIPDLNSNNHIINLPATDSSFKLFVVVKTAYSVFIPVTIYKDDKLWSTEKMDDLVYCMYFGIVFVMFFYNLFVYFSTRDKSYLFYVLYTITFGLAQFAYLGYFSAIIVQSDLIVAKQVNIIFSAISGIMGIAFFMSFLQARQSLPIIHKLMMLFIASYLIVMLLGFFKEFHVCFTLLNLNGISIGVLAISGAGYLSAKKNRPARFFMLAWITFMLGLVIFVLTNTGVAPYNVGTKYILPLTSAIEISLLSFGLADKINILSKENETLVKEQNIRLEIQVKERTAELADAYESLKQTQTQLVNSEKMASLGHLTAGIAHEINNPINFISANINPLKRDIEDYEQIMEIYAGINDENVKEKLEEARKVAEELDIEYVKVEIQKLLSGIDEGARRTTEIVKNLKIFSHIDQAEQSYYSVNEGLKSTVQLLSHKLGRVHVREELAELPPILCYPGKLNQVFMNLLSNAVDAVNGIENAEITIRTFALGDKVQVEVEDNGTGIPEHVIKDIFNPFFTTKDVGSGTGLGLSISLSIIEEHGGSIDVKTEPGKFTKFTVVLPVVAIDKTVKKEH